MKSRSLKPVLRAGMAALMLVSAISAVAPPRARALHERPPRQERRSELAATTIIRGSRSAMIPVHLDRPTTINNRLRPGRPWGPNTSVRIEGDGRVAGFALTRDHPSSDTSSRFLTAVRFARCNKPGCARERRPIFFMQPFEFTDGPNMYELPAGNYRLYLIADGSPVKVTLRFEGLHGKTSLRPRGDASVDVHSPRVHVTKKEGQSIYSAGDVYRSGRRGFFISTLYVRGEPFEGALWGMCAHPGPPPPADVGWYGPHCSALGIAGLGSGAFGYFGGGPNALGFYVVVIGTYSKKSVPPTLDGRRILGAWFASQGPVKRFGTKGFYLSYDL